MQHLIWSRLVVVIAVVIGVTAMAWSADFTQPERTPEFTSACRRQDKKLKSYFAKMITGATSFHTMGSYRVLVHRDGLTRKIRLIPVRTLPFADLEAFQDAARHRSQVIGVMELTFTHGKPFIVPGTHLLVYDGLKVHVVDVHDFDQAALTTTLSDVPPDATLDPVVGSLTQTAASLASLTLGDKLQLYLQLTDKDGNPLKDADGSFKKCLLEIALPEITKDDDTPGRSTP